MHSGQSCEYLHRRGAEGTEDHYYRFVLRILFASAVNSDFGLQIDLLPTGVY